MSTTPPITEETVATLVTLMKPFVKKQVYGTRFSLAKPPKQPLLPEVPVVDDIGSGSETEHDDNIKDSEPEPKVESAVWKKVFAGKDCEDADTTDKENKAPAKKIVLRSRLPMTTRPRRQHVVRKWSRRPSPPVLSGEYSASSTVLSSSSSMSSLLSAMSGFISRRTLRTPTTAAEPTLVPEPASASPKYTTHTQTLGLDSFSPPINAPPLISLKFQDIMEQVLVCVLAIGEYGERPGEVRLWKVGSGVVGIGDGDERKRTGE
ncbi:hypothetical protein P280DRAFT_503488 [Massarina eburnea CBS 473.64]|uniref:Uncharacterized protein n=1 Tax=Massarina eburnea CBS 473.64 TaxID=1395130 RepID=A0A6A6SC14_9PLEO|nr:hypothetical protein P280DRAFT_503488 [Massarina eburnea CBS 473.64]